MIDFMLLASPRSGTTWAANLLTTDTTLCLHDPLFTHHYSELDGIESNKRLGVSCTGLCLFPEYVNSHQARKVVLHRDLREINRSLDAIGFFGFMAMMLFLLILVAGFVYEWMKGALDWG